MFMRPSSPKPKGCSRARRCGISRLDGGEVNGGSSGGEGQATTDAPHAPHLGHQDERAVVAPDLGIGVPRLRPSDQARHQQQQGGADLHNTRRVQRQRRVGRAY